MGVSLYSSLTEFELNKAVCEICPDLLVNPCFLPLTRDMRHTWLLIEKMGEHFFTLSKTIDKEMWRVIWFDHNGDKRYTQSEKIGTAICAAFLRWNKQSR